MVTKSYQTNEQKDVITVCKTTRKET